jgi:hypothetical protein
MDYKDELAKLPSLAPTATALLEYAASLVPGTKFVRKGRRWVSAANFVAFEVRAARARIVLFTLFGSPSSYRRVPALPLWRSRSSYCEFTLTGPRELGAAASYVATAAWLLKYKHKHSIPKSDGPVL